MLALDACLFNYRASGFSLQQSLDSWNDCDLRYNSDLLYDAGTITKMRDVHEVYFISYIFFTFLFVCLVFLLFFFYIYLLEGVIMLFLN